MLRVNLFPLLVISVALTSNLFVPEVFARNTGVFPRFHFGSSSVGIRPQADDVDMFLVSINEREDMKALSAEQKRIFNLGAQSLKSGTKDPQWDAFCSLFPRLSAEVQARILGVGSYTTDNDKKWTLNLPLLKELSDCSNKEIAACVLKDKTISDNKTAHEKAVADQKTAYDKTISDNKTAHEKAIADQKTAYDKTISDNKTAHEKAVADQKTAYDKTISDNETTHEKAIAAQMKSYDQTIINNRAEHDKVVKDLNTEHEMAIDKKDDEIDRLAAFETKVNDVNSARTLIPTEMAKIKEVGKKMVTEAFKTKMKKDAMQQRLQEFEKQLNQLIDQVKKGTENVDEVAVAELVKRGINKEDARRQLTAEPKERLAILQKEFTNLKEEMQTAVSLAKKDAKSTSDAGRFLELPLTDYLMRVNEKLVGSKK